MKTTTEQEEFWQSQFGNEYTERNRGDHWIASNCAFFSKVLSHTNNVKSVLELGSNLGLNLIAISKLLPKAELSAVEINGQAAAELKKNLPKVDLTVGSILEYESKKKVDLAFTKVVMIHINPDKLPLVYEALYNSSTRYILVAEYFNPAPTEVVYRGHSDKLFKRDFAGEMLKKYQDLKLVEYGFVYHDDPNFPQDDINWFLMEKKS